MHRLTRTVGIECGHTGSTGVLLLLVYCYYDQYVDWFSEEAVFYRIPPLQLK